MQANIETRPRQENLRIAGVPIQLRSDHSVFWRQIEQRYGNFFCESGDSEAEVVDHHVERNPKIPFSPTAWSGVDVLRDGDVTTIARGNARGEWRRSKRTCRILQDAIDYERDIVYRDYGCDTVIRVILAARALERGGLFVHSAGVERAGKGYLFVGESGAGKSTLAKASAASTRILSDDLTFVDGSAEPALQGTPFFGDLGISGVNQSTPLTAIYFLHKAAENEIKAISTREAVGRMIPQVGLFAPEANDWQRALDRIHEICSVVPTAELHFLPDDSFWDLIDD